jgi:hypothetical protein
VPPDTRVSVVQALPSLQASGHAPGSPAGIAVSQVSRPQGPSTTPLPQLSKQSESVVLSANGGQQPSPSRISVRTEYSQRT